MPTTEDSNPLLSSTSGAMYSGVPQSVYVRCLGCQINMRSTRSHVIFGSVSVGLDDFGEAKVCELDIA